MIFKTLRTTTKLPDNERYTQSKLKYAQLLNEAAALPFLSFQFVFGAVLTNKNITNLIDVAACYTVHL